MQIEPLMRKAIALKKQMDKTKSELDGLKSQIIHIMAPDAERAGKQSLTYHRGQNEVTYRKSDKAVIKKDLIPTVIEILGEDAPLYIKEEIVFKPITPMFKKLVISTPLNDRSTPRLNDIGQALNDRGGKAEKILDFVDIKSTESISFKIAK